MIGIIAKTINWSEIKNLLWDSLIVDLWGVMCLDGCLGVGFSVMV